MRVINLKYFNKILIVLFFSISSMSSFAAWETGNSLYEFLTSEDYLAQMMAIGYITGVFDGYDAEQHWDKQAHYICLPTTITKKQLADIVKKYLEDNPAERHLVAGSIVLSSLAKTYPCN